MNSRFLLIVLVCLGTTQSVFAQQKKITIDDVVKQVSSDNFNVYQNALRVYQSKENVQAARGNLLPKLNLWNVAKVAIDWTSAIELLTEDIAPFLVPANWFRADEVKLLYLAEKEGYRALWANEVLTAKALYIHLLLDQSILEHVRASKKELDKLLVIVKAREALGGVPQGTSREIEIRTLGLQEDQRALEVLISEEIELLNFALAIPSGTDLVPAPINMPNFETLDPLVYADFEFRAVNSSPERRQFEHFFRVVDLIKKEVFYSFLGASKTSRGAAGGIFDNIPIQDGLGFGAGPSVRMAEAQREILKVQQKGVVETVKRHLRGVVNSYNLDLQNYSSLKKRVALTKSALADLYQRLQLGDNIDILTLIEASRNYIQADTAFFSIQYRFLANEDKLSRLIFHGDYSKQPIIIEKLGGKK